MNLEQKYSSQCRLLLIIFSLLTRLDLAWANTPALSSAPQCSGAEQVCNSNACADEQPVGDATSDGISLFNTPSVPPAGSSPTTQCIQTSRPFPSPVFSPSTCQANCPNGVQCFCLSDDDLHKECGKNSAACSSKDDCTISLPKAACSTLHIADLCASTLNGTPKPIPWRQWQDIIGTPRDGDRDICYYGGTVFHELSHLCYLNPDLGCTEQYAEGHEYDYNRACLNHYCLADTQGRRLWNADFCNNACIDAVELGANLAWDRCMCNNLRHAGGITQSNCCNCRKSCYDNALHPSVCNRYLSCKNIAAITLDICRNAPSSGHSCDTYNSNLNGNCPKNSCSSTSFSTIFPAVDNDCNSCALSAPSSTTILSTTTSESSF